VVVVVVNSDTNIVWAKCNANGPARGHLGCVMWVQTMLRIQQ
jgi:hypothetical protein